MKKSIYILVCASVHTFNLLVGAILVNLENKLMFAYLKAQHVDLCLDYFGLNLYPLQNFELVGSKTQMRLHKSAGFPEPWPITFVISTSPHGFIMLGSSDSKKEKRCMCIV